MKLPTTNGQKALRMVVRQRQSQYEVTRPGPPSAKSAMGEELPDQNTTAHTENLWLFMPRDSPVDTQYGDRLEGSLQGLAMPSADIERSDVVTFQGIDYEVEDAIPLPDENNPVLLLFGLEKRVN